MAFYKGLNDHAREDREKARWIAGRLLDLRESLRRTPLGAVGERDLVIGSWNLRAFDEGRPRLDESYHYIAEIIDHFDICAVQEVKEDLRPLERLLRLLGPNWTHLVTDVTAGGPGNRERLAFLYDRDRVRFRNRVGELTLPREDLIDGEQIARTPYFAAFQAGWFRFTLTTVHVRYGGDDDAARLVRAAELSRIARVAAVRSVEEDEVHVLIGDMNVEEPGDLMMQALTAEGLSAPFFGPTNLGGTRHYDQIALTGEHWKTALISAGAFDWRGAVFRATDGERYRPVAEAARGGPYADWGRSYQEHFASHEMSDHLPIWITIRTDWSDDYLRRFL